MPSYIRIMHNRPGILVKGELEQKCYIMVHGWSPVLQQCGIIWERKRIEKQTVDPRGQKDWNIGDVVVIPIVMGKMEIIKRNTWMNMQKKYQ